MKHVFLISSGEEDCYLAENYSAETGEELIILVAVPRAGLASDFDQRLQRLRDKAEALSLHLAPRGVHNRIVIEWGEPREVLANCLQRENAVQLGGH